jgi:hypothetical protein
MARQRHTTTTQKIHEEECRCIISSSIAPERRANMWVLNTTANDTVSDAEDVATGSLRRPSTRNYINLAHVFMWCLTWSNLQVKWRQVALLERDILLKNLKSVLESLRGRVTGKTKDEIEESISMVGFLVSYTSGIYGHVFIRP